MIDLNYCMHDEGGTWDEYDARGIYLTKVCDKCAETKLSSFRPDVLTDFNYYTDELIEESD